MSNIQYEPCGGCGADHPSKQCIGCRHPFREIQPPARQEGETPRTDKALVGATRREIAEHARSLERELSAKQAEVERLTAKVENQRERIVYLEGATNHACGTPLSLEKSKNDKLRSELESLKAAQGQVLEAFDPNVMKPILIGEFKQQLLTHDEEGEECYQDIFIHWDVIKQIMRAIKEHALPTPPVDSNQPKS